MHIRKDDQVMVISGDERGRKGRVLKVFPAKNRAIVEGLNLIKRHMRPTQANPQGGIVEKEAPIHISNLMLICPKCNQPTRVSYQFTSGDEKKSRRKVRTCKKCGEMIVSGS